MNVDHTLATPTILAAYTEFDYEMDSVEITSPMPGSTIHYTLDGSFPSPSSPIYKGKIPIKTAVILNAIVRMPGWHPSFVASQRFKYPVAPWNESVRYLSVIDARDGQSYPTVKIGTQTWMAKNLNYRPRDTAADERFFSNSYNGTAYSGTLSVKNKICPEGWTIPSQKDWRQLRAFLLSQPGFTEDNLGNSLKANGIWNDQNAIDVYGFRAVPDWFETERYVYYSIFGAGFWSKDLDSTGAAQHVRLSSTGAMDLVAFPDEMVETVRFVRCLKVE